MKQPHNQNAQSGISSSKFLKKVKTKVVKVRNANPGQPYYANQARSNSILQERI